MMHPLHIEAQSDSPEILLDKDNNIFKISGNSFIDDPVPYYMPIFNWLDDYKDEPNECTHFQFKLNYINTASIKQIANLLIKLEEINGKSDIKVIWFYQEDDEDLYDEGKALNTMIRLNFEFVAI